MTKNCVMSVRDLRNECAHTLRHYKLSASEKASSVLFAIENLNVNDVELLTCKEVQNCRSWKNEVKNADVSILQKRDLEVLKEQQQHQEF